MTTETETTTTTTTTAVVILGFFGSTAKNLERPAALWSTIAPEATVLAFPAREFLPTLAGTRDIEQRVRASGATRVIVHLFSNRGAFQYIALVLRGSLRGKLAGVVLDSSPGVLSALSFMRAVAANARDNRFRFGLFTVPPLLVLALALYRGPLAALTRVVLAHAASELASWPFLNFFAAWDPARAPSLFVFSEEDALILASTIRAVASKRHQTIGNVSTHQLHGSAHVRHLQAFPESYAHAVSAFAKPLLNVT